MSIRFIDEDLHAWIDYPVATGVAALVLTLLTNHRLGVIRVLYYWVNAAAVLLVTFVLIAPSRQGGTVVPA